jgi:hypothetical protein
MRQNEVRAALKATHNKHLDEGHIQYLGKQEFHFPKDINKVETMLGTFVAILTILFGSSSLIVRAMHSWEHRIQANFQVY